MKNLLRSIMICVLVMATSCANSALRPETSPKETINLSENETRDLEELFKSCNSTLESCSKDNRNKEEVINKQKEVIDTYKKQSEEMKNSDNGIMNSKTLWFILGSLFVGGIVVLTK